MRSKGIESSFNHNVGSTINIDLSRSFSLRAIKDSFKYNKNCNFYITVSNGQTFPLGRRLDSDGKALRADIALLDGIESYIAGKYKDTVEYFQIAARNGSVDAYNLIGVCYCNAIGIIEDAAKAVNWFEKAAKRGNLPAMGNLAYCYENGKGVKKDIYKTESYYIKIALQGDLGGVFGLASFYYRQADWEIRRVAIELFELAKEYGYQKAQSALEYIDLVDDYDEDDDFHSSSSLALALASIKANVTGKEVIVEWQDAMDFDKKLEHTFIPEYSVVGEISESNRKEIGKSVRRIINRKR